MFILKIFTWFGVLLPVFNILGLFSAEFREEFGVFAWVSNELISLFISFCLLYFVVGRKSKCPHCKKPFALKQTGREIVSKEKVSVLVENKTRNTNGDVTGTTEQYVPGIRTNYKIYYTCKYCGEVTCRTYSESNPTL